MRTIDNTSSLQAYDEAKLKVKTINEFLDGVEKKRNKPEVIIKDLVSSFLIPDVERKKIQREVQFEERKYLEAARKTIKQAVSQAGAKLDSEQMLSYAQHAQMELKPASGDKPAEEEKK
jgi:hypothetical protein